MNPCSCWDHDFFFGEVQAGIGSKTSGRTKTHHVNYVDEGDQEPDEHHDESVFCSGEVSEDSSLEHLQQEGDEDAILMQQFEESLIESLQSDSEIATCLKHIHGSPKAGAGKSEKPWFLESEGFQGQEQREIQGRFQ